MSFVKFCRDKNITYLDVFYSICRLHLYWLGTDKKFPFVLLSSLFVFISQAKFICQIILLFVYVRIKMYEKISQICKIMSRGFVLSSKRKKKRKLFVWCDIFFVFLHVGWGWQRILYGFHWVTNFSELSRNFLQ